MKSTSLFFKQTLTVVFYKNLIEQNLNNSESYNQCLSTSWSITKSIQNVCKKKPCLIQIGKKKKESSKVMLHHLVNYQNQFIAVPKTENQKDKLESSSYV